MIKNIVFDVGEVLFAYNPNKIISTLLPETSYQEFHLESLFHAPLWQQLDRADVTPDEARQALHNVSPHPDATKEVHHLFDNWIHHLDPIREVVHLFEAVSADYPVYILSNFQDEPFDILVKNHPFLTKATGMVVSGKLNVMKPEPEIYDHLLTTYNLTNTHTLFIDDREENIEAAKKKGMHGIVYKNPTQLFTDLRTLGLTMPKHYYPDSLLTEFTHE